MLAFEAAAVSRSWLVTIAPARAAQTCCRVDLLACLSSWLPSSLLHHDGNTYQKRSRLSKGARCTRAMLHPCAGARKVLLLYGSTQ